MRLRKLDPESLDAEQRALYDSIAHGPRARGPQSFSLVDPAGRLEGPFNAMLLSPRVGRALQDVGAAVRFGSQLSDRAREIAILVVAHRWRSAFEVYAHEAVGRTAGLSADELTDLRAARFDRLPPEERLIAQTVHSLATDSDLADADYAAAAAELGEAVLFELTTLVGYYATLALQLRVFRVEVPVAAPPA